MKKMMNFYSEFVKKGDLCFDVGANFGNRTEIFVALGAKVIAIEPQEFCIHELYEKFGDSDQMILVEKALGKQEGTADMWISNIHVLSSLSPEWIERVTASGRFLGCDANWNMTIRVDITTLDRLITQYGHPDFCKIDVEGGELEVLQGLSNPIKTISFEFTQEYIDCAIGCVDYLAAIGNYQFNYSFEESMEFQLTTWISTAEMYHTLKDLPPLTWGDIYARLVVGA